MGITEFNNKESWNKFVAANSSPSSFLQSWEWGELQKALGNKVCHLVIPDFLQAQVIIKKLPLGRTYLEIPKGPISLPPSSPTRGGGIKGEGGWEEFIKQLKAIAKKEKAVLARINPPYPEIDRLDDLGFVRPELLLRQREPQETILVDLLKSEEELLLNMHEKSRYNIRLAQRKGVKVRIATQEDRAFEFFLELLEETTKRDKIVSWPRERFYKFREVFMKQRATPSPGVGRVGERSNYSQNEELTPRAELLIGEYQNHILAAAIIMLFGDAGTYLYAASSDKERTANAPSLVLWEAILEAKCQGKHWYDMWGVAPQDAAEDHPWAGITRFKSRYVKLGVTGKEIRNIGTWDLILDKKFYRLFKVSKIALDFFRRV